MACGMVDANVLYDHLKAHQYSDLPAALAAYSNDRVKEGRAITDLNFVRMLRGSRLMWFMLSEGWNKKVRGIPTLFEELQDPTVPYSAMYER